MNSKPTTLLGQPAPPLPPTKEEPGPVSLAEFLASVAPGSKQTVIAEVYRQDGSPMAGIMLPAIRVHCVDDECNGQRWFTPSRSRSNHQLNSKGGATDTDVWVYTCRNCQRSAKLFAVFIALPERPATKVTGAVEEPVRIRKIGEDPPFGIKATAELSRFLSNDAELFAKGMLAENDGLGIGAFAYYRRVVDNQKNHLLEQIEKVVKQQGGLPEIFEAIEKARNTDKFTRAMEQIKGMLPGSLRVDGHNPLQLIYDQLSDGVHEYSDEVCLARAAIIREALSGMAGRITALLKEDASLRQAISKLTNLKQSSAGGGGAQA